MIRLWKRRPASAELRDPAQAEAEFWATLSERPNRLPERDQPDSWACGAIGRIGLSDAELNARGCFDDEGGLADLSEGGDSDRGGDTAFATIFSSEPNADIAIPEPPRPASVGGFVEAVAPQQIRGWAFRPDDPSEHLEILVSVEGHVIGRTRANLLRDDLVAAGIGDGDHAFVVNLERPLAAEVLSEVSVSAKCDNGLEMALPLLGTAPKPRPAAIRAHVDFPLPATDCEQFPVFVLGSARSGTSAVAHALLSTGKYGGRQEGHLLELAACLRERVADFYAANGEEAFTGRNTLIQDVPASYFDHAVAATFVYLARTMFPGGFWLDKTPKAAMVAMAPLLREIWPNARFIFMKRRGIENVASRCRKFPGVDFRSHCLDWSACMEAWLAVRDTLAGSSIELEQLFVAHQPEEVGNILQGLLGLTEIEVRRLVQSLATDHPQLTDERFGALRGLGRVGWPDHQVDEFRMLCGAMMDAYGYDYGDAYHRSDAG